VKVFWTKSAVADRHAIYDHIENDNAKAALAMDIKFSENAAQLSQYPNIGRDGRVVGTRELVTHENYILVYDIKGETVRILRILHVARMWPPTR
jgi:addiction module RelE/StbE family toxin